MQQAAVSNSKVSVELFSVPIHAMSWDYAQSELLRLAKNRTGAYVCICNVHSLVAAIDDCDYRAVIERADLVTPDGAPIAWMMRRLGYPQDRINGPDLMERYLASANSESPGIFLYGGDEKTLEILVEKINTQHGNVKLCGYYSPPFRPMSAEEDAQVVSMINNSGAGIVWVGLGCPKQEFWMSAHRSQINAVMVGVGAAFDYHAGTLERAPLWMQRNGLEWLYRLLKEPKRLWKRYFYSNTKFMLLVLAFYFKKHLRELMP